MPLTPNNVFNNTGTWPGGRPPQDCELTACLQRIEMIGSLYFVLPGPKFQIYISQKQKSGLKFNYPILDVQWQFANFENSLTSRVSNIPPGDPLKKRERQKSLVICVECFSHCPNLFENKIIIFDIFPNFLIGCFVWFVSKFFDKKQQQSEKKYKVWPWTHYRAIWISIVNLNFSIKTWPSLELYPAILNVLILVWQPAPAAFNNHPRHHPSRHYHPTWTSVKDADFSDFKNTPTNHAHDGPKS